MKINDGGLTMPTRNPSDSSANLFAAGGLAVIGGAGWLGLLMPRIWAATAYGPICGHISGPGPHCIACYGALALVGLGVGMLGRGFTPAERGVHQGALTNRRRRPNTPERSPKRFSGSKADAWSTRRSRSSVTPPSSHSRMRAWP